MALVSPFPAIAKRPTHETALIIAYARAEHGTVQLYCGWIEN